MTMTATETGTWKFSLIVESDPEHIGLFRTLIDEAFAMWGVIDEDTIYQARTVVTELTTNVINHCPETRELHAQVWRTDDGHPVIDVLDTSTAPPRIENAHPLSTQGRGLGIVACFAQLQVKWITEADEVIGKIVSAVLPKP